MSRDAEALCALLDKEREGLLRGEIDTALALADRKAHLVDRLERDRPSISRESAQRLHRKAERNAALLSAAREGMNTATKRIEAILLGVRTRTYTADGSRTELPTQRKGFERRA